MATGVGSPGSQLILEVCHGGLALAVEDLQTQTRRSFPVGTKLLFPPCCSLCIMLLWVSLILHHEERFALVVRADLGPPVV